MINVLLADDEPLVIEGLRSMINWDKYGFRVCGEAMNGADAYKMIQDLRPELVLTDINMPVINGLELIERSNRTLAKPPKFVILSGYDNFEFAHTAMYQRVTEYLLKPVDEDEIGAVLIRLRHKIQEEIAAEQSQSRIQFLLVNNILNRLIQGEFDELLEQQAAQALLLPADTKLRCILIDNPGSSRGWIEKVNQFYGQKSGRTFVDSEGRVGVIMPDNIFSTCRVQELTLQLHNELAEEGSTAVLVTISSVLQGLGGINELYRQALEINQYKRYQERSGVYSYSEPRHARKREDDGKEKFKQLTEIVITLQTCKINAAVEDALQSITEGGTNLKQAIALVGDLELNLCRQIEDMDGDPDDFMRKLPEEDDGTGGFTNYYTLKKYVLELSLKAAETLAELNSKNENNTIFHVIQYVDREFRSKLQLQDLAKRFQRNSAYIGQLFKKETGRTFNDYLNDKRIEEAKQLLRCTQMKMSEIAMQVGYPNTGYFICTFKNRTGVLPSHFKHKCNKGLAD